jgi:hypothetical protein
MQGDRRGDRANELAKLFRCEVGEMDWENEKFSHNVPLLATDRFEFLHDLLQGWVGNIAGPKAIELAQVLRWTSDLIDAGRGGRLGRDTIVRSRSGGTRYRFKADALFGRIS